MAQVDPSQFDKPQRQPAFDPAGGGRTDEPGRDAPGYETQSFQVGGSEVRARVPRGSSRIEASRYARSTGQLVPETAAHQAGSIAAGVGQAVAGPLEGLGTLASRATKAITGYDPSRLVPPVVTQGLDWLHDRARYASEGRVAEQLAGAGAMAAGGEGLARGAGALAERLAPRLGQTVGPVGRYAAGTIPRSVVPAAVQPHADPNSPTYWSDELWQTIYGAPVGEAVHLAGEPGARVGRQMTRDQARYQSDVADYQTALTKNAAEHARIDALEADQEAKQRQYRADRSAAGLRETLQERLPRQTTQEIHGEVFKLLGIPGEAPRTIDFQTASATRERAGRVIGDIYKGLNFDPNKPGWLPQAVSIRDRVASQITDPKLKEDWDAIFADEAVRPAFEAEPGARPSPPHATFGPPVQKTVVGPDGVRRIVTVPSVVPAEMGPHGVRSGPISGDKLNQLISKLGDEQDALGQKAQGEGQSARRQKAIMADGLRQIRQSIREQVAPEGSEVRNRLDNANRAYTIANVIGEATKASKDGIATPANLIDAWEKHEGSWRYGRAGGPMEELKKHLANLNQAHTFDVPKPTQPPTVNIPKRPTDPAPPTPPETKPSDTARRLGRVIGHRTLGPILGHPAGEVIAPLVAHPGVSRWVRRAAPAAAGYAARQRAEEDQPPRRRPYNQPFSD